MNKDEKLFWSIIRNVFLFTHIKSFLKFEFNSKSYQDSIDVEWMLQNGRIELLRDKVTRSEYLKFPDGLGFHYKNEDDNDSFKLIFQLIHEDNDRDYQFYCQLFTNYSRYIISIDNKAIWALKTNCLVAFKVLVDKFNYVPSSYKLLPISIISNSFNLIDYLLNTSNGNNNNNNNNIFYKDNSKLVLGEIITDLIQDQNFKPISNQELLWKIILTNRYNIKFDVILLLVDKYNQIIDINLLSPNFKSQVLDQLFKVNPFNYFTFKKLIQVCKLILLLKIDKHYKHSITMDQIDKLLLKPEDELETCIFPTTPLVKQILELYFSISNYKIPTQFQIQFYNCINEKINFKKIELRETSITYGNNLTIIYKYSLAFGNISIYKYWLNTYFNQRYKSYCKEYIDRIIDSFESKLISSYNGGNIFSHGSIKNNESLKREYILNLLSFNPKSTLISQSALLYLLIRYNDLELFKFTISNISNINEIKLSNKFSFSSCIKSNKLFEYCWEIGIFKNQFENQKFVMDQISKWLEYGEIELIECFEKLTNLKNDSNKIIVVNNGIKLPLVSISYIIDKPTMYSFIINDNILPNTDAKRIYPDNLNILHYINIIKYSKQYNFKYNPYELFDIISDQFNYQNVNWIKLINWILTNCQNEINSGNCHFGNNLSQFYLSLYQTNRIDQLLSIFQNENTSNIRDLELVLNIIGYQGDIINLDKLLKLDGFSNNNNIKRDLIKVCLLAATRCGRLNVFQYILDNQQGIFRVKGIPENKELLLLKFSSIIREIFYQDDLRIFEFIINNLDYPEIFATKSLEPYLQEDSLIYYYHYKGKNK